MVIFKRRALKIFCFERPTDSILLIVIGKAVKRRKEQIAQHDHILYKTEI